MLKNFYKYKDLLLELVKRDLKVKYRRSILGYLWSLLNPLIMMLVISAVFSEIFGSRLGDVTNYPIYLLSGQIIFGFFSEATSTAMSSIVYGGALLKKVYIPKYMFPLSRVVSTFVNLLFSLVAIVIVMLITRTAVTPLVLLFPIPLLYVLIFSIAVGLILSACMVFFRDTIHLYGVFLTALMYFTPIFYPENIIKDELIRSLLKFNPLYHFIGYFRNIILYGQLPTYSENMICISICVVAVLIAVIFFRKFQDRFVLYI